MILANGRFVYVLAELIQELAWSGATQSDETYGRPENSQELYSGFVQIWKTEYLFPHSCHLALLHHVAGLKVTRYWKSTSSRT